MKIIILFIAINYIDE